MSGDRPKLEQALKYVLGLLPSSAGKTELVKYVYLADLMARQVLGRQISEARYIWYHYGPWSKQFDAALAHLRNDDLIHEETYPFKDWYGYIYRDKPGALAVTLTPAERRILQYVVEKYSKVPLRSLLDDVVYNTVPMKQGTRGKQLPMALVDNEIREQFGGIDLEEVLEGERELDEDQGVALQELLGEVHSPTGT